MKVINFFEERTNKFRSDQTVGIPFVVGEKSFETEVPEQEEDP